MDVLYAREVGGRPADEILGDYAGQHAAGYASVLVEGVLEHLEELDALIESHSHAWALDRMPILDLNLLRLGLYEILYREDVPTAVTVDELVELAKTYSTEDSGRFVHAILARVAEEREEESP